MKKPRLDRRIADRFPIERDVHFKTMSKRKQVQDGRGQTINISSAGVLFTTNQPLRLGNRLEVAISWPARLNESVSLQLVAEGRIVRCDDVSAALSIQHYEFRTCSQNTWISPAATVLALGVQHPSLHFGLE